MLVPLAGNFAPHALIASADGRVFLQQSLADIAVTPIQRTLTVVEVACGSTP